MKAPCCLLGAAALPRPPERARRTLLPGRAFFTCMLCVWWLVMMVVTRASANAACPVRTDARDVASKAFVSPQVVEAVVREAGGAVPGRPYTVTAIVVRKLRGYKGRARVRKRDILTLTFRYPHAAAEGGGDSAGESDSVGDCLVSAALEPRHKYLLFLGGSEQRGVSPLPVAPPEPASRKLRRLVRKTVCKNCAQAPRIRGLQDDSVVEGYNLTLECSAEGLPTPELLWFKDDEPLAAGRNVRIRTWAKRLRKKSREILGRRTRSPAPVAMMPGRGAKSSRRGKESTSRSRPPMRNLRRRHHHSTATLEAGEGRGEGRIGGGGGGGRGRGRGGKTMSGKGKGSSLRRERVGRKENAERKRRILHEKRHERRRRIGRDGRRRLYSVTTNEEVASPLPRRRQHHDQRWNSNNGVDETEAFSSSSSSSSSSSGSRRRRLRGGRGEGGGGRLVSSLASPSRRAIQQVSQVRVRSASSRDAGQYKCVARSVVGQAEIEASIRVVQPIDPHTLVDKCPYDGYCLNGGTCMMFTVVGELVCQCAEGFKGQRCQEKEVYPTFNRNCHGPVGNVRHSQGRRCPRNQPAALWELLQQILDPRRQHKVTPWTKAQLLLLPTARPRLSSTQWPP